MRKNKPDLEFDVLVENSDHIELYDNFSSLGKLIIYDELNFIRKILFDRRKKSEYDLIYANSIASSTLLNKINKGGGIPVICHVHESNDVMNNRRIESMKEMIKSADHYIAVSGSVYKGIRNFGVEKEKISLVYNFLIPPTTVKNHNIRKKLNIPKNAFIVGTLTANADSNKAPQRVVEVAKQVTNKNVYFVYTGLNVNDKKHTLITNKILQYGLNNNFLFIEPVNDPNDYINMFDMYFISSKVESFSLTMLEAGSMKTPVLSFDDNEGPSEILNNNVTGLLVNSTKEAAKAIERSVTDTAKLETMAENFYREIDERFNINEIGEKIFDLLTETATGKPFASQHTPP
jgi:glycosyltransferase involved in cell wall biosynthesis